MLSQKNYIRIADMIRYERDLINQAQMNRNRNALSDMFDSGQRAGIEKLARRLAEYMQEDNHKFNQHQFLHVAGIE